MNSSKPFKSDHLANPQSKEREEELGNLQNQLIDRSTHIVFKEETHQYFNQEGEEYVSVSSILDRYRPPFEREVISARISKRKKIPVSEVTTQWDIKRDFSIVRGTEFHLYVETFLKEGRKIKTVTPIEEEIKSFHLFWDTRNQDRYEVVATELVVVDDELKLAGTIDCIVRHVHTKNFFIFDWKTNRNIRSRSIYNQKMESPIGHLDDCEINKYSLQMAFYSYLFKKAASIEIKNSYLIHLSPEANKKSNTPYQVFPVKDLLGERDLILAAMKSDIKEEVAR